MSDAKAYRAKMKEKARRLAGQKNDGITASTWKPDEPLDADVITGMRPVSKKKFKNGGKVGGANAQHHAGRPVRKSGGGIGDQIVNRDAKEANEERDGKKHVGGMKCGGRAKKLYGGGLYGLQNEHSPIAGGLLRKNGGRTKKADGGEMAPPPDAGGGDPIDAKIEELKAQIAALEAAKAQEGGGGGEDAAAPPPDEEAPQPPMKKGGKVKKAAGGKATAASAPATAPIPDSPSNRHYMSPTTDYMKSKAVAAAAPTPVATVAGKKVITPDKKVIVPENKGIGPVTDRQLQNKGGKVKKQAGGEVEDGNARFAGRLAQQAKDADAKVPKKLPSDENDSKIYDTLPVPKKGGGRAKRADGGPVKGRTNINIIIAPQGKDAGAQPPPPDAAPPAPPMPDMTAPPPAMPVPPDGGGGAPGGMMGGPGGPGGGGPLPPGLNQLLAEAKPRKDGGKVIHMEHGAGGGLGRLEKIRKYGAAAH